MASTSRTPDRSTLPPQSEAQPSSSAEKGICLPFDEAINQLPSFMQPKDEREHDELGMFLSQVHELHKPDGHDASAMSIFNYIHRVLESNPEPRGGASRQDTLTRSEAFDRLPELPVPLPTITGDISSEIAYSVNDKVDSHNITMSVIHRLQQYSWETKVALIVTAYILTFGDFGLNLCAESKVSLEDMSMFVKQLIEITSCVVEFEKLPKVYMTLPDPKVRDARTHFVVAVYWIIRAVMLNSASHIMTMSSRGYKLFGKAISPPRDGKLESISSHLKTKLLLLQDLLEGNIDMEAYNKIKEIVNKEDHTDKLEVVNALISNGYDEPQLYDCLKKGQVYLNELEGKYVLLLIADFLDINILVEWSFIRDIQSKLDEKFNNKYKLVVLPIVDPSLQPNTRSTNFTYEGLNEKESWCIVNEPQMIKKEVIKFFKDDWNFKGQPIIVVLDPSGKIVNQNAIYMLYVWLDNAFPFTRTRQETLWKEQNWSLDLLFHSIEPSYVDLMNEQKYIFVYGGVNKIWVRSFAMNVKSISSSMQIPIEMLFVGNSHDKRPLRTICQSDLSPCLPNDDLTTNSVWFFWRRVECMIYSLVQHGKFDIIFHEIQRLHNYDRFDTDWAILAKGSKILLTGKGNIVLSTLEQYDLWREKASEEGFEVGFISHYWELYRKKLCVQRIVLPTAALNDLSIANTMNCSDCQSKMDKYITFVCNHPPWIKSNADELLMQAPPLDPPEIGLPTLEEWYLSD